MRTRWIEIIYRCYPSVFKLQFDTVLVIATIKLIKSFSNCVSIYILLFENVTNYSYANSI